jgi:hypothetical protein
MKSIHINLLLLGMLVLLDNQVYIHVIKEGSIDVTYGVDCRIYGIILCAAVGTALVSLVLRRLGNWSMSLLFDAIKRADWVVALLALPLLYLHTRASEYSGGDLLVKISVGNSGYMQIIYILVACWTFVFLNRSVSILLDGATLKQPQKAGLSRED